MNAEAPSCPPSRIEHPPAHALTLDRVLHALADPVRRHVLRQISRAAPIACSDVAPGLPRSTVSVHLRTLREAGLIEQERQGQMIWNRARADGAQQRFPELLGAVMAVEEEPGA